jgi:hypothetical protein
MSFKGLGAFREEQQKKTETSESPFFKLTEKGQKALIRPLVELDEASLNFSEKNGVPLFTQEFANPQKFWLTIVDTREDEGNSVGWEMVAKYGWFKQKKEDLDPNKKQHANGKFNWNPNQFVYLPVLVKDKASDDPRVEVMRVKYRSGEFTALVEFAESEREYDDNGNSADPYKSITDRWWNYSRNREEGFAVRYNLTPKDPSDDVNVEDFEVPDLEQFVNRIPYGANGAEQHAFLQTATNTEMDESTVQSQDTQIVADSGEKSSAITQAKW